MKLYYVDTTRQWLEQVQAEKISMAVLLNVFYQVIALFLKQIITNLIVKNFLSKVRDEILFEEADYSTRCTEMHT